MNEHPEPTPEVDEEPPPLGSWGRIYAVVIGSLGVVIALLIWFTETFS
ncbi:MAG: hypothetical protein VYE73_15930 [Acidobacteriota bacterium]|nr:hypothetical protein [Acidobacteriota bacterium]